MNAVQRADAADRGPAPYADKTAPDPLAGAFASVLESARLSAAQSADLAFYPGREAAALSDGRQRRLEDLSASSRSDALERSSRADTSAKPGRVDRLRESVRDGRYEADPADEPSRRGDDASDRAGGEDRASRVNSGERDLAEQAGGAEVGQDTSPDVTEPREQRAAQVMANGSDQETEPAGSQGSVGYAVAAKAGPAAPAVDGSTGSANNPGAEESDPGLPAIATQPQAGDRQTGSGVSQDSAQIQAAKTVDAAARPGTASVDFQDLLAAAGRHGGQSAAARSTAATGQAAGNAAASGVDLNEAKALEELARVVRASIGSRRSTMMLHLQPPELGQLRIEIQMRDQVLTLRFQAQTQAGHDALQSRLGELRGALEQQGIQLNQVEVELRPPSSPAGSPNDSTPQQQSAPQDGQWAFGGSQGHHDQGPGGGPFAALTGSDAPTTAFGEMGASTDDGHDEVARPAETGVDLVV